MFDVTKLEARKSVGKNFTNFSALPSIRFCSTLLLQLHNASSYSLVSILLRCNCKPSNTGRIAEAMLIAAEYFRSRDADNDH